MKITIRSVGYVRIKENKTTFFVCVSFIWLLYKRLQIVSSDSNANFLIHVRVYLRLHAPVFSAQDVFDFQENMTFFSLFVFDRFSTLGTSLTPSDTNQRRR